MTLCQFSSLTSIIKYGDWSTIAYVDNDNKLPYTMKDGQYQYFTRQENGDYVLAMTSKRDLQEQHD